MSVSNKVLRLPTLSKVFVNNHGNVCLTIGHKTVTVLYADAKNSINWNLLSYLDFTRNVLYYNLNNEELLLQYTNDKGITEAWYYKRNNLDGKKYMGFKLNDTDFEAKRLECSTIDEPMF